MGERIRSIIKLTMALATGMLLFVPFVVADEDLEVGFRSLATRHLGSPGQYERLVDEIQRDRAASRGDLDLYETCRSYDRALAALRELDRRDSRWTDQAVELIRAERDGDPSAPRDEKPRLRDSF